MAASLLQADPLEEQVRTFLSTVDCLQAEVRQLRSENTELREEVCKLLGAIQGTGRAGMPPHKNVTN